MDQWRQDYNKDLYRYSADYDELNLNYPGKVRLKSWIVVSYNVVYSPLLIFKLKKKNPNVIQYVKCIFICRSFFENILLCSKQNQGNSKN